MRLVGMGIGHRAKLPKEQICPSCQAVSSGLETVRRYPGGCRSAARCLTENTAPISRRLDDAGHPADELSTRVLDAFLSQEFTRAVIAAPVSTTPILAFCTSVQPLDRNFLLPIGTAIENGERHSDRHRDRPVPAVRAGSPVAQLRMFLSPYAKALAVPIQVQFPPRGGKRAAAHKLPPHPVRRIAAYPHPRGRGPERDEVVGKQDPLKGLERGLGHLSPPTGRNAGEPGIDCGAHRTEYLPPPNGRRHALVRRSATRVLCPSCEPPPSAASARRGYMYSV
jgi:hypothetical protein